VPPDAGHSTGLNAGRNDSISLGPTHLTEARRRTIGARDLEHVADHLNAAQAKLTNRFQPKGQRWARFARFAVKTWRLRRVARNEPSLSTAARRSSASPTVATTRIRAATAARAWAGCTTATAIKSAARSAAARSSRAGACYRGFRSQFEKPFQFEPAGRSPRGFFQTPLPKFFRA
jgi:hypothetical protein